MSQFTVQVTNGGTFARADFVGMTGTEAYFENVELADGTELSEANVWKDFRNPPNDLKTTNLTVPVGRIEKVYPASEEAFAGYNVEAHYRFHEPKRD